jgi:alkylation response protein AidB-like acyl-CoA dehydrogenase
MSFAPPRLDIYAEHAAAVDADGALSKGVVAELTAAGFPRHLAPRRDSDRDSDSVDCDSVGREVGDAAFEELFAAVAAIAEDCASAAWCAALWALHGKYAARLPAEGGDELWRDLPDVRISAAVVPPAGSARRVGSGWSVDGRWAFASGVEHAHWVLLAARRADCDVDEVRVFAVRGAELEIERTWNAMGLRGTGSHTVLARDLFVPDRRSMTFEQMTRTDPAACTPRRHAVPAHLVGGPLMAAVALGAARAALTHWTRHAAALSPRGTSLLSDSGAAESLALSSGELEAARLLLTAAVRRADSGPIDEAVVAGNLRDAAVGVSMLVGSVDRLLRVGGTAARAADGAFHRAFRDVHTVASHGVLRIGTAAGAYARAVEARGGS